jgi:hypothetical protein
MWDLVNTDIMGLLALKFKFLIHFFPASQGPELYFLVFCDLKELRTFPFGVFRD